jgi:hypothetical protein
MRQTLWLTYVPHVRAEADSIEVDHFGSDEFRSTKEDFQLLGRVEISREAKVNDFDSMTISIQA